jgi:hypothetical protein
MMKMHPEQGMPPEGSSAPSNGMGHSPGSKEHLMMKMHPEQAAPPEGPTAPSNGMGHSPASKEHILMKRHPEDTPADASKNDESKPSQ